MKKGIIYARHLETRECEKTVEEQVKECEKFAKENEIEIVDSYCDYLYDKDRNPNAFDLLLSKIKKEQVDYVIVFDSSVLGRKGTKVEKLMKNIYSSGKEYVDVSNNDKEVTKLFNFIQKQLYNFKI